MDGPDAEYLRQVRMALVSNIELSKLIPLALGHSEVQVREYLIKIARRMEADGMG